MSKKNKESYGMQQTGIRDNTEIWHLVPSEIIDAGNSLATELGDNTSPLFDDDNNVSSFPIEVGGRYYDYVPFGDDNSLPYHLRNLVMSNLVTAQCQHYNILTCYGQGVRFFDRKTKERTTDKEIRDFCLRNNTHRLFLQQSTDIKFLFFSVTVVILNREDDPKNIKIIKMVHKEACHVRMTKAVNGHISHILYADWRQGQPQVIEAIPLLDIYDPLTDLELRMGRMPDPATGLCRKPSKERMFAIMTMMPTMGNPYYPMPYYTSVFRDAWFDIYRLISVGKRSMIRNTCAPRLQIEIHRDYWFNLCSDEGITDPIKIKERIKRERENIVNFCCKPENAGKAWITGYYLDVNGKENRMVRIVNLNDSKKEGGDWSGDMEEASNALCFAFGVHPNMVGATPGKSQMNNSGSDKRELFTLKQATETVYHDVICVPYHIVGHFNGWDDKIGIDVPMIQLTTLDENKDSKKVITNPNPNQ